jgi:Zn-finger protein
MKEIVNSSLKWFNKDLTQNELIEMYTKSYCSQTKTISVIFTNTKNPKLIYNNKNIEMVDDIISILRENNHYKKCMINIEIEYHGIYFYADNTKNKWIISSIDITDISNDNNNEWINRDDIVDKLSDNIGLINNKMNKRIIELQQYINELEENKLNINKLFLELKVSPCNNIQDPLNKINQLIIYQESKINNI